MPWRPTKNEGKRITRDKASDRAYDRNQRASGALAIAGKIRRHRKWREFREWYLTKYPLCSDPFGEHKRDQRIEPAKTPHHIIGLIERPDLAYDESNLKAVCEHCHALIEQMVRRGEGEKAKTLWACEDRVKPL